MKRIMFVLSTLMLTLGVSAQQYRPEGRAFVCVNGQHRFTRALYGSPTEWRVETSDRPVFAIYKKKDYRNVQFRVNGVLLDKTDFCEARYEDGMRSYVLRHKAWGAKATLRVKVVASLQAEQTVWRFQTAGFNGETTLDVVVSWASIRATPSRPMAKRPSNSGRRHSMKSVMYVVMASQQAKPTNEKALNVSRRWKQRCDSWPRVWNSIPLIPMSILLAVHWWLLPMATGTARRGCTAA